MNLSGSTGFKAFVTFALAAISCCQGMAQGWAQTSAPILKWSSITCSADGKTLAAAAPAIYISTNSGLTWAATAMSGSPILLNADATRLFAVDGSSICVSTNLGATWTSNSTPITFPILTATPDGQRLYSSQEGRVYTSTNAGSSWALNSLFAASWQALTCSGDGRRVVAARSDWNLRGVCGIWVSADFGNSWVGTYSMADMFFTYAGSTVDGSKMFVGGGYGLLISRDSGMSWSTEGRVTSYRYFACSADGNTLALAGSSQLATSNDAGVTWDYNDGTYAYWKGLASSADGAVLAAASGDKGIYMFRSIKAPSLKVAAAGAHAVLSWRVPSANFVLQASTDPSTTNWTDISVPTTLVYTNLTYQTVLAASAEKTFFRLCLKAP